MNQTPKILRRSDLNIEEVQRQVDRILASSSFARSPQLSRFLSFCVEHSLHNRPEQLREQNLAVEVFKRPPEFDTRRDPIVRVEARRLRSKLDEYYAGEGRLDPVIISLQRGEYIARFAPAPVQPLQETPAPPARLIVVEDEGIVAKDLENRLRNLGYILLGSTGSGEAAVSMVDELRPDLVLMDVVLAGNMSGPEAARRIWERFQIPVVYLTAFSDPGVLGDIKNSESYGYILKPFEPRQVHAVIQLALNRRMREMERQPATEAASN